VHFLPGYAPELKPDEFVWNHLKRQGVSKKPLRRDGVLFRSARRLVRSKVLSVKW
jgi:transposase